MTLANLRISLVACSFALLTSAAALALINHVKFVKHQSVLDSYMSRIQTQFTDEEIVAISNMEHVESTFVTLLSIYRGGTNLDKYLPNYSVHFTTFSLNFSKSGYLISVQSKVTPSPCSGLFWGCLVLASVSCLTALCFSGEGGARFSVRD